MELLIINQGESKNQKTIYDDVDAKLTSEGMQQACNTGLWLKKSILTQGFHGYVSPGVAPLQTGSVISEITGINFTVNSKLRNFDFTGTTEINLPASRSLLFENINWPPKLCSGVNFTPDNIDTFLKRINAFHESIKDDKKVVVVASPAVCIALAQIASGIDLEEIIPMCEKTKETLAKYPDGVPTEHAGDVLYLTGMLWCGITMISGGVANWFSKTVVTNE